jgi:hypothetical protein
MPFRFIQPLRLAGYASVVESTEVIKKNGNIEYQLEDKAEVSLPEAELFDLTNQLEAGVSLEEVNSKVMSTQSVNADNVVRKYTRKSTNASNNGEE